MSKFSLSLLFCLLIFACRQTTPPQVSADFPVKQISDFLTARSAVASYSGAVLVAENDSVLLAEGFGLADRSQDLDITAQTKFKIGSLTKTFTALAILQLHEKNQLSIEDRLSEYFPDFPKSNEILLKHLLTHSSGLGNWRDDWHEKRKLTEIYIQMKIASRPLEFNPGEGERYSNGGYWLLARVIEKVTGLAYEDYCEKYIFQPAGMHQSGGVYYPEKNYSNFALGYEFNAGLDGLNQTGLAEFLYTPNLIGMASAYSTVEDLYRFTAALSSTDLISSKSKELLFSNEPNSEYTLGNWLVVNTRKNGRLAYFSGVSNGYESALYYFLDQRRVIIALNNHQNTNVFTVTRAINKALNGDTLSIPKQRSETTEKNTDFMRFQGNFQHEETVEDNFELIAQGDRLFIFSNEDPWEELFVESDSSFYSRNYDLQIIFHNSKYVGMVYNGQEEPYVKIN